MKIILVARKAIVMRTKEIRTSTDVSEGKLPVPSAQAVARFVLTHLLPTNSSSSNQRAVPTRALQKLLAFFC